MIVYTLAQAKSADSGDLVDVLKYSGTVLAAIVGILGAIPATAGYIARRKATVYNTRLLRMSGLEQPAPWLGFTEWPPEWEKESHRRKYWRGLKITFEFFVVVVGIYFAAVIYAIQLGKHSPVTYVFLYVIAVLLGALIIACLKWIRDLRGRQHRAEQSPFRSEITLAVKGSREDVIQYCYIVLTSIGATIVEFDEERGNFSASIGLWIRPIYYGSQLLVSACPDRRRPGHMVISMSSSDIGPGLSVFPAHARNVKRFVRQWNFSGIEQEEAED